MMNEPTVVKPVWQQRTTGKQMLSWFGWLIGVPLAFLAVRNTSPNVTFIRPIALLIIVTSHSINSLIWALLLVAIIGPGILTGTVAIALLSVVSLILLVIFIAVIIREWVSALVRRAII